MSGEQCKPGDTTGFPIRIGQKLFSAWPSVELSDINNKLQEITVPSEYSVNWAPSSNSNISITSSSTLLQINLPDTYITGTTLSYGDASYNCCSALSIINNNHSFFCNESRAQFLAILAFQMNGSSKSSNPSSPDIIIFCRPLAYVSGTSNPSFWSAVDRACSTSPTTSQNTTVDLSSVYGYDKTNLLPLVKYQTCINARLTGTPHKLGSLRVSVNLIIPALYLDMSSSLMSTTSLKYTLPVNTTSLISLFPNPPANTKFQFNDGSSSQQTSTNYLVLGLESPTVLSAFSDVINKIEIQVPESQLGNSLNQVLSSTIVPAKSPGKKAYKCYTVDPKKDIVNGQIMVDPTTGENIADAQAQPGSELNNALSIPSANIETGNIETGIMPGDVENVLSITITVFGSIGLFGYLLFILLKGRDVFNTGNHTIPGAYNDVLYHIVIFLVIFATLILFGLYLGKNI
jgi:hypothetical protein